MICARCDQPIRRGEPYTKTDPPSLSAARPPVTRHVQPCPPRDVKTPIRH